MGALLLLPEPSCLLLGKACEGPWVTVPSGHSVESRQPQPWHCGQRNKEGKGWQPPAPSHAHERGAVRPAATQEVCREARSKPWVSHN